MYEMGDHRVEVIEVEALSVVEQDLVELGESMSRTPVRTSVCKPVDLVDPDSAGEHDVADIAMSSDQRRATPDPVRSNT